MWFGPTAPFGSGGDNAAGIRLGIEANYRRGDLRSILAAHRRLHDRVPLGSKTDLPRHVVSFFVLAQLARSRQYHPHIAQGRRDVELDHRGQAAVNALNDRGPWRLTLSHRLANRKQRQHQTTETQKRDERAPINVSKSRPFFHYMNLCICELYRTVTMFTCYGGYQAPELRVTNFILTIWSCLPADNWINLTFCTRLVLRQREQPD